ncbi:MAG: TonB-dependent receptor [Woeseiaceae bacterium]|nr:TonB-dependent receptor [Woeseiaceae bacterium]
MNKATADRKKWIALGCLLLLGAQASLADQAPVEHEDSQDSLQFNRPYFDKFNVVSALDIVLNVPGFVLDEGRSVRGFEATAGNVLLNGERPVAKSRSLTEILSQIPASAVRHVALASGSVELLGSTTHTSILDVVLIESPDRRTITYELLGASNRLGHSSSEVSMSALRVFDSSSFNLGLQAGNLRAGSEGPELVNTGAQTVEQRTENQTSRDRYTTVFASAKFSDVFGGVLGINGESRSGTERSMERSERTSTQDSRTVQTRSDVVPYDRFEVSTQFEYSASRSSSVRALLLVDREEFRESSTRVLEPEGLSDRSETDRATGETILAVSIDHRAENDSLTRYGLEYGETFVDNTLSLFEDDGNGEVPIDTPGANTRVDERRVEGFVSFSMPIADRVRLDSRLTIEASEISQDGDVEKTRQFVFVKPRLALTIDTANDTQWRVRLEQTVGQLNFADFVSSNDFDDDEFEFGNPDLEPDQRWRLSAEYERRIGNDRSIRTGIFGERITDVQDLLPLTDNSEVPGNIGSASVFGFTMNGTTPLSFLPWQNAYLDFDLRAQKSKVTDPVTLGERRLSNERDFRVDLEYRQAISSIGIDYGVKLRHRTSEFFFGFDELEKDFDYVEVSVFAALAFSEKTRLRLDANNVLDEPRQRSRAVYVGSRATELIRFVEDRTRRSGLEVVLTLSGQF